MPGKRFNVYGSAHLGMFAGMFCGGEAQAADINRASGCKKMVSGSVRINPKNFPLSLYILLIQYVISVSNNRGYGSLAGVERR